jgi:hypothetical protein
MNQVNPDQDLGKEILEILLESELYLELPLKERRELFRHIVNVCFYTGHGRQGSC